jgi:hypothetical protein
MIVMLELINGLQLGIEYIGGEDDDEFTHAVVVNLALLRFVFMSMKQD